MRRYFCAYYWSKLGLGQGEAFRLDEETYLTKTTLHFGSEKKLLPDHNFRCTKNISHKVYCQSPHLSSVTPKCITQNILSKSASTFPTQDRRVTSLNVSWYQSFPQMTTKFYWSKSRKCFTKMYWSESQSFLTTSATHDMLTTNNLSPPFPEMSTSAAQD